MPCSCKTLGQWSGQALQGGWDPQTRQTLGATSGWAFRRPVTEDEFNVVAAIAQPGGKGTGESCLADTWRTKEFDDHRDPRRALEQVPNLALDRAKHVLERLLGVHACDAR